MLKNYLLTAWKVFLRRKFFTFINLFGICITLTVIVVAVRVADNHLHPTGPEKDNEHFLVIEKLVLTNDEESRTLSSQPGFKFIKDYVLPLKAPEIISAYTTERSIPTFKNGKKIRYSLRRTDANYWKILQFDFIQGDAFDQRQFESGASVAVISQQTAIQFFGVIDVIGKSISVQNQKFEVVGVVSGVPRTELAAYAQIWLPYTTLPSTAYQLEMLGDFKAMLYHSDKAQLDEISSEFLNRIQTSFVRTGEFARAYSHADNTLQAMARELFGEEKSTENYVPTLFVFTALLSFIFMLLPSINMVNLSISRIMERSSEIGVRKAFGASTTQLVWQFIVENILLTFIGGLFAYLLSVFILNGIEVSGLIPYAEFRFNFRIFAMSLFMIFIFGLISGVYPAFKMAHLNPVQALKGGE